MIQNSPLYQAFDNGGGGDPAPIHVKGQTQRLAVTFAGV